MTKMNRRDYLKEMAIGAGVVAGVAQELFAGPQKRRSRRKRNGRQSTNRTSGRGVSRTQFQDWPDTQKEPSMDAPVSLIFDGLMGFFYNAKSKACDIGFHSGKGNHMTGLRVWEIETTTTPTRTCKPIYAFSPLPDEVDHIDLGIEVADPLVDFFEDNQPMDPYRKTGNPKDFRWLLDLDGSDFYPKNYDKKKKFKRTLTVRQGTFYTRMITESTFLRVDLDQENNNPKPMGRMPLFMAAAIAPSDNQYVSLKLQKKVSAQKLETIGEVNLYKKVGSIYEIQFLNHCDSCVAPKPHSSHEEERNDFHFMRKVLNLPGSEPEYGIKIDVEVIKDITPNFCSRIHYRVSDPAPCMGAGYGGGGIPR